MNQNNDPNKIIEENDNSEFSETDQISENCLNYAIPFFKLFLFLPGKIMRLIFQIGDFYYLMLIFSISFEYIAILFVSASEFNKGLMIFYFIFLFFYAYLMGNILTIPTWELFQLRWIKNKNPIQTFFNIFNINDCFPNYYAKTIYTIEKTTNFICGLFFYAYIILLVQYFNSKGAGFDKMNATVLLYVPGIKFFIIYISYFIKSIIVFSSKKHRRENSENENTENNDAENNGIDNQQDNEEESNSNQHNNEEEEERSENRRRNGANRANRNKVILDPFVTAMINHSDLGNARILAFFIIKIIIIIVLLIFIIYFYVTYKMDAGGIVFSLLIFLYVSLVSLFLNIPIWFLNLLHYWDCKKIILSREGVNVKIRKNRNNKGFKYISFFCQVLPVFVTIALFAFYYRGLKKEGTYFKKIYEEVKWDGRITGKYPRVPSITNVKSAMCYSTIHGLNLMQIAVISAAPYYSDLDNFTNLLYNSFYRDTNYKINLKFLRDNDDDAVLLRADFDTKNPNDAITIFAVRGSQTRNDWWLDIEIFVASAMLSVARLIPFLQRQEGYAAKVITGFMTLPLSLMVKSTMTYRYTNHLFEPIDDFMLNESNINRSVLFTGHSLGGGLSKVLANKYEVQSIAVSGPGITPVEYKFRNNSNYDKYFKSKLIDIIPDRDIVPRFEISGGTRHRVLCKKDVGECHNKLRTICQMGISCNDEYHVGDFCSNTFDDYDEMKELAHL